MTPLRLSVALAILAAAPVAAQPMQPTAPPVGGVVAPGPSESAQVTVDVRAEAASGVPGCAGFVGPEAPDAVVDWAGGDLHVWTRAPFDATLLVFRPDGQWACNDDAEGTSPLVQIDDAPAGRYAVWAGSFGADPAASTVTVYAGAAPAPVLNATAAALAGDVDVMAGFEAERGGVEVSVPAGGPDWTGALDLEGPTGDACWAFVNGARPTARVRYTAGDAPAPLVLTARTGDEGLALIVEQPDGEVVCSSAAFFGPNPTVVVEDATSGDYAVWVGTSLYAAEPVDATLLLSETAPEPQGFEGGMAFSEGQYTVLDLTPPAARMDMDGLALDAAYRVRPTAPNPVSGLTCSGFVETAPTTALTLGGEGPIAVTAAAADVDLILLLQTPGGAWFCSDDAEGTNPGIQVDTPEDGAYLVWVGTFSAASAAVDVTVTAAPGEIAVDPGVGLGGPSPFEVSSQSEGTYAGDAIRPGGAATLVSAIEDEADVEAGGAVLNPVEGTACAGFVSERPTAEVTADGPVTISASGGADLTLVVRSADGAWACSDDADGTDPRVRVEAPGGAVSVWVGTFSRSAEARPARLRVDRE